MAEIVADGARSTSTRSFGASRASAWRAPASMLSASWRIGRATARARRRWPSPKGPRFGQGRSWARRHRACLGPWRSSNPSAPKLERSLSIILESRSKRSKGHTAL